MGLTSVGAMSFNGTDLRFARDERGNYRVSIVERGGKEAVSIVTEYCMKHIIEALPNLEISNG